MMDHSVARAGGRDRAELVFDQAERRVFRCQNDIAAQCQFYAAAVTQPVDRRDHRDFKCFQVVERLMGLAVIEPEGRRFQLVAAEGGEIDAR